jgi:hypothetical protein
MSSLLRDENLGKGVLVRLDLCQPAHPEVTVFEIIIGAVIWNRNVGWIQ